MLFQLALSGIAAVAFEDLARVVRDNERVAPARLWPVVLTGVLSAGITLVTVSLSGSAWAAREGVTLSSLVRAAPWAMVIIAMATLVVLAANGRRWALTMAIVLAAIDLGAWGYSYAYRWGPIRSLDELAAAAEVPPGGSPGTLIDPLENGGPINLPLFRGFRLLNGYFGLDTTSVLDTRAVATARLAGATWRESGTK